MASQQAGGDARVAVLVDCDNTAPEILEHALSIVAPLGRVVLRRGYGNHATLANRWQDALVRLAFTPCLQYQYAAGKNTADIALALDAMEAMFDARADAFCLVTSDSDFAHLCRKLRERGAAVHIVGERKAPEALRNACDRFFEWVGPEAAIPEELPKDASIVPAVPQAVAKRCPKSLVVAVAKLVANAPGGRVGLGALGQHLKSTDPAFSPKAFGHAKLSSMIRAYPGLVLTQGAGAEFWVGLKGGAGVEDA